MASGEFPLSDSSAFVVTRLVWYTSGNNPTLNQSTINVDWYAYTTGTQPTFGAFVGGITIAGNYYSVDGTKTVPVGGAEVLIGSASRVIAHGSNGTASVSVSASGGISGSSWTSTSGGGTATLDPLTRWIDQTLVELASQGAPYNDGVSAHNATSYSIIASPENLPSGINLNSSTGLVAGTPILPGVFRFIIRAANSFGSIDTSTLTILVRGGGRVWNGTSFVSGNTRVWNGASFVPSRTRIWNGSNWVN
jgi:hypothetical protein